MKNEIYLRRKLKVFIPVGNSNRSMETDLPEAYIATMMRNVEDLGFSFSHDLISALKGLSIKQAETFYVNLVKNLKKMIGANVRHKPMYPNFPEQVMDMAEAELYINAILHYWTEGRFLPESTHQERFPLIEKIKPKAIGLGTKVEFLEIGENLINSKTSLSEADKADVEWFVENYKDKLEILLPKTIALKENVALVSKCVLRNIHPDDAVIFLKPYFKTATDVLRLATALSPDGDISLAKNTHYKSFSRPERKMILALLENCGNIEEDMVRYKTKWIRLGERLHPSEYKNRFEKTAAAFYKLRNNINISTFNSKVEAALSAKKSRVAADLLTKRPGDFARRLDHALRMTQRPGDVVHRFAKVANKVATPVLLQVMAHFRHRDLGDKNDMRVFFPKGSVAKAIGIENNLPKICGKACKQIVNICINTLREQYTERESIGNVYLDEKLASYLVPFSQRSASTALRTIVRGSAIDLPEGMNTLRSFIHWKDISANCGGRVDIDLSAVMYDDDWQYIEHVSYTNLKSARYNACHSGDIIEAPHGASEFIDLDVGSVRKFGGRYIIVSVHSYTRQPFCEIPECFMGWMSRKKPKSGEIYSPKTVENKIDLTANTTICIPMIVDLVENKIIWTDLALKSHPDWSGNNIENSQRGMVAMGKAMADFSKTKPNLYDLFKLHTEARGNLVSIEEADVVFTASPIDESQLKEGARVITQFDDDVVMGEFL